MKKSVKFKCVKCGIVESIPIDVVLYFDELDGGDPSYPPRFDCENCNGIMKPVYYKSTNGIVYKFDD